MVDHHHPGTHRRGQGAHLVDHGHRLDVAHAAGGLVEEDVDGRQRGGPDQFQSAGVAVIEFAGSAVPQLPQPGMNEELLRGGAVAAGTVPGRHQRGDVDVLQDSQGREQTQVLERAGQSGPGDLEGLGAGDGAFLGPVGGLLGEGRRTLGGLDEAGDHVEQGRLTRAVGTDEAHDLQVGRFQPGSLQRSEPSEVDGHVDGAQLSRLGSGRGGNGGRCGLGPAEAPSQPVIDLPVLDQAAGPEDHEPQHRSAQHDVGEPGPQHDVEHFGGAAVDLGVGEMPGGLVDEGDEGHAEHRTGDAVAPPDDQHHQREQGVVEKETGRGHRPELEHPQRGGHRNDRD